LLQGRVAEAEPYMVTSVASNAYGLNLQVPVPCHVNLPVACLP
jgi:hypothetical protein